MIPKFCILQLEVGNTKFCTAHGYRASMWTFQLETILIFDYVSVLSSSMIRDVNNIKKKVMQIIIFVECWG
jgi:hypothetical protein